MALRTEYATFPRLSTWNMRGLRAYALDCRASHKILVAKLRHLVQVFFLKDFVAELLPDMSYNQHGIVDQLVCSMAQRYMGGFGSTFSGYIHRLRGYRDPALGLDLGMFFTNYPEGEEAWQAAMQEDNGLIADAVWWPRKGIPAMNTALWAREWSLTWTFPTQMPQSPSPSISRG